VIYQIFSGLMTIIFHVSLHPKGLYLRVLSKVTTQRHRNPTYAIPYCAYLSLYLVRSYPLERGLAWSLHLVCARSFIQVFLSFAQRLAVGISPYSPKRSLTSAASVCRILRQGRPTLRCSWEHRIRRYSRSVTQASICPRFYKRFVINHAILASTTGTLYLPKPDKNSGCTSQDGVSELKFSWT
jgi:hypothetical protein